MGVMECFRAECDQILCSDYSNLHGYICWECKRELKENPLINVASFMATPKQDMCRDRSKELWEETVDLIFKER